MSTLELLCRTDNKYSCLTVYSICDRKQIKKYSTLANEQFKWGQGKMKSDRPNNQSMHKI